MAADDVVPAQELVGGFGFLAIEACVDALDRSARAVILALGDRDLCPIKLRLLGGLALIHAVIGGGPARIEPVQEEYMPFADAPLLLRHGIR